MFEIIKSKETGQITMVTGSNQTNTNNLNNINLETSRSFRNKKWEYLKHRINELATNSVNKKLETCRGIYDFKRGRQPRSNLVKNKNGCLLADSHNISNTWKNYLSQLLNLHKVSDARQKYVQLSCAYMILVLLRLKLPL
jgi:hypothetical protein